MEYSPQNRRKSVKNEQKMAEKPLAMQSKLLFRGIHGRTVLAMLVSSPWIQTFFCSQNCQTVWWFNIDGVWETHFLIMSLSVQGLAPLFSSITLLSIATFLMVASRHQHWYVAHKSEVTYYIAQSKNVGWALREGAKMVFSGSGPFIEEFQSFVESHGILTKSALWAGQTEPESSPSWDDLLPKK